MLRVENDGQVEDVEADDYEVDEEGNLLLLRRRRGHKPAEVGRVKPDLWDKVIHIKEAR